MFRRFLPTLAALSALAGCAYPANPPALPPANTPAPLASADAVAPRAPVTILISIDGFRPDYLDRGLTPVLSRLAADGVTGPMRPSFPSKTFPNHWTIVTGLRPDRHGITANSMEDPARAGEVFTMANDDPFWWNAAPPIWVTAEKAGIPTASMYWPGSNVGWGGVRASTWPNYVTGGTRPTDWQQFSQQMPNENRVRAILDWMRRPAAIRPRLVTTYFDVVDTAGHQYGPTSPQVNESGPYATFAPLPGREAAVAAALLKPHAHMECWRKAEIPAHLHYGKNPRVPPFLCLAEDGWMTYKTAPTTPFSRGEHGFDNNLPSMRALFIANGPAFARGQRIEDFDNVSVAPLLRTLLGLPADPTLDGTDAPFRPVLTQR